MNSHNLKGRKGFTLIELLVVIAIIALLMGLVFPALNSAIRSAKKNKAETEARNIALAVELFYKQYRYLPVPRTVDGQAFTDPAKENEARYFADDESKRILRVLMKSDSGDDNWDGLNFKGRIFLDLETLGEDGTLEDPWGTQYRIKLDRDLDSKLEYFSAPEQYRTRVIVVSAGPDREWDAANVRDNIANIVLEF